MEENKAVDIADIFVSFKFERYNSFEEIKEELKFNYKDFGIELDDKFIEEHFGRFSGVYYA